MANSNTKLVGARIFLRDPGTGETIGEETIRSHNPLQKTFTIVGRNLPVKLPERVNALIVSDTSMDYNICAIKNVSGDNERIIELGIIKTDEKRNERGAPRFKITGPAIVRELCDFMGLSKTKNVFLVYLKDMSVSGVMFSAPVNQFEINDEVLLDMSKIRPNTYMKAKVVRKQNKNGLNEEVACKIIRMINK